MSTFVELTSSDYSATAFAAFDPAASGFTIGNARALMWLSQLAYETGKPATSPRSERSGALPASRRSCGGKTDLPRASIPAGSSPIGVTP